MKQTKPITQSTQGQASVDFKRFQDLTRRLVAVPKKEIQDQNKKTVKTDTKDSRS